MKLPENNSQRGALWYIGGGGGTNLSCSLNL